MPSRVRQISEALTVNEKHLLLWDILLNSTPNYRKATASRLRKMVVVDTRTPSPDRNCPLKENTSSEIEGLVSLLQKCNPWWYVLNVDHEPDELSRCCHDTFKQILNPIVDWSQIWNFILPVIGTTTVNGKVRLKAI